MWVRIWKEIRQLGSIFLVTNIFLVSIGLFSLWDIGPMATQPDMAREAQLFGCYIAILILFTIGLAMMSVTTYGGEFSANTMDLLLAQPLSRKTIWWEKHLVLLLLTDLTIASMMIAMNVILLSSESLPRIQDTFSNYYEGASVFSFICFWAIPLAGPIFTLYLRQSHAAFWLLMLSPGFLFVGLLWWFYVLPQIGIHISVELTSVGSRLLLGSFLVIGGYYTSLRRLRLLEMRPPASGSIRTRPRIPFSLAWNLDLSLPKAMGCNWRLLAKEMRLEWQSYIFLFLAMIVFILSVTWTLAFVPSIKSTSPQNLDFLPVAGILAKFFSAIFLFYVLPAIAGSDAFAPERNLGVEPWQISLPKPRWQQWLVKGASAALPALIGCLAVVALNIQWFKSIYATFGENPYLELQGPLEWDFSLPFLLFSICFYTSSFARGSIHSLLCATGIVLVSMAIVAWTRECIISLEIPLRMMGGLLDYPTWGIVFPLGLLPLLFSYSNYRARQDFTTRHFAPQVVVWVIALGLLSIA